MELFDGPALFHEAEGEVIEESGVRGGFAAEAEVGGGSDESFSEVLEPDAVDHNTHEERVLGAGDPAGELESSALIGGEVDGFVSGDEAGTCRGATGPG